VRQFTSIDGLLADLPINKLLSIAARSDVDRMSADHLSQQSASHLEVATGAEPRANLWRTRRKRRSVSRSLTQHKASHSEFGNLGNLLGLSRVTAKTDIASSNTNLAQYLLRLGIVDSLVDLLGLGNGDGLWPRIARGWDGCRSLERQRRISWIQRHSPQRESHRRPSAQHPRPRADKRRDRQASIG